MVDILQVLSSPLGQRILGIYFTSTSLSVLLTHYSEKYLYNKYIMPYLRGTKTNTVVKPSYQQQLNQLKRKVANNTAYKQYSQTSWSTGTITAGAYGIDLPITTDFIAKSNFSDLINGDKWANHYLKISGFWTAGVTAARIIVYTAKKTGTVITNPTTQLEFGRILDPAAFSILYDGYINRQADLAVTAFHKTINLRNLVTINNLSSGVLERGDIHVLMSCMTTSTNIPFYVNTQLCFSDK